MSVFWRTLSRSGQVRSGQVLQRSEPKDGFVLDNPTSALFASIEYAWTGADLGHFFGMAESTNTTEASLSYTTEQQQLSTPSLQK